MIRTSQSNDLTGHIASDQTMNFWAQPFPSNNSVANEFDGMSKQEHEDVILFDHSFPVTSFDFGLDLMSDLLNSNEQSEPVPMTNLTEPLNIDDRFSSSFQQSHPNQNSSVYSSLGISPQFTGLSIHHSEALPSTNQQTTLVPNYSQSILATSYPLPIQSFPLIPPDIKRFRSASMNDGPTCYNEEKNYLDTYRHKTANVHNTQQSNPSSSARTFLTMNSLITNDPGQTVSVTEYPREEAREERIRTISSGTIENLSEIELWSDIEQNSSEALNEIGLTSDEEAESRDLSLKQSQNANSSLFWQYNVQSKGPKTKRALYLKQRDPHIYREFSDPVYQIKLTQSKGQSVSKLRKGDGNDVTPNPSKLYQLGKQIRDLSKDPLSVYHGIYHSEQTANSNDSVEVKKEKNKMASRACRLRKKAQHEANKLKLHGLNEEHKSLLEVISTIKLLILQRYQNGQDEFSSFPLSATVDELINSRYARRVAGNTDGFVQATINEMEKSRAAKEKR